MKLYLLVTGLLPFWSPCVFVCVCVWGGCALSRARALSWRNSQAHHYRVLWALKRSGSQSLRTPRSPFVTVPRKCSQPAKISETCGSHAHCYQPQRGPRTATRSKGHKSEWVSGDLAGLECGWCFGCVNSGLCSLWEKLKLCDISLVWGVQLVSLLLLACMPEIFE